MKKPTYLLIAFFATMLLYIGYPLYIAVHAEETLNQGFVYRFKPQPVDPYDFLRGRYVTLAYEQNSIDFSFADEVFKNKSKVYLEVAKDGEGYAQIVNAYEYKPNLGNYLMADITRLEEHKIFFQLPFNRYYMNEEDAPILEKAYNDLIRQNRNDSTKVLAYIDVRVKSGEAIIEELYLDGKTAKEFIEGLK